MIIDNYNHVLIVGMGKTGYSISEFLKNKNILISVYDSDKSIHDIQKKLKGINISNYYDGPLEEKYLNSIDCIAVSPGVDLRNPILKNAIKNKIPIINDLTLFFNEISNKKTKVIGVTGTNGKTTVCTLLEHLFLKAGYKAVSAGNIGLPMLEIKNINDLDFIILELSSFQLEIKNQLSLDVGVILNITEDHMDRYDTFDDYASAKYSILEYSKKKIICADDEVMKKWDIEDVIVFSERIQRNKKAYGIKNEKYKKYIVDHSNLKIEITNVNLLGQHNQLNIMAAIATFKQFDNRFNEIESVLQRFPVINNRLEWVKEVNGINFYNDSKATNVSSAIAAVNAFEEKNIFLIAGGDSKGQNLSLFSQALKNKIRKLYLIGKDAELIKDACKSLKVEIKILKTMKEATHQAFNDAISGDIVLLAPACASYDMYRNYIERGNDFKSIVANY
ncbi:UDP-N-acetylmuramoyl-L-alanine--D-glutamate ligase [Methylophilaceae bacterium]|nr:UDP-N-acetylmuramoyl-L-alanine--D-glutamate ligase [Methylophilaceae bacterium]